MGEDTSVGVKYDDANLSGRTLKGRFVSSSFNHANLRGAKLIGEFTRVSMKGAILEAAKLTGEFIKVNFLNTGITEKDLSQARTVQDVTLTDGRVYSRHP